MSNQVDQNTTARVREIIERLSEDKVDRAIEINDSTSLFSAQEGEAPIFDSFEAVMILIELENTFGFQINDEDMMIDNFNTVDLISQYIEEHR